MSDNTGKIVSATYKDLLKVENSNSGVDGTLRAIESGNGNTSPLEISSTTVNITSDLTITDTTESSSPSTGSLIIDGGLGVDKNIFCDGNRIRLGDDTFFLDHETAQSDTVLMQFDTNDFLFYSRNASGFGGVEAFGLQLGGLGFETFSITPAGNLNVAGIDTVQSGSLKIGPTNASSIAMGNASTPTNISGDFSLASGKTFFWIDRANEVVFGTNVAGIMSGTALGAQDQPFLSDGATSAPKFGTMRLSPAVQSAAGATPVDSDISSLNDDTFGSIVGTGGRVFFFWKNSSDVYYVEATQI